jgi:TetR/AcrR family transcriptional repressor of lmrAB and yxaGH operons
VSEAGRKSYAFRLAVLREKLVADGAPPARAERLAVLCVAALQGALIQSRVERSGAAIETAADELARMLEALPAG